MGVDVGVIDVVGVREVVGISEVVGIAEVVGTRLEVAVGVLVTVCTRGDHASRALLMITLSNISSCDVCYKLSEMLGY